MPIIDTDTHVLEPADLWTSRLPTKWGADRLHVERDDTGRDHWYLGDRRLVPAWQAASYGWNDTPFDPPPTWDDVHPACRDPKERAAMMEASGITAAVVYPNLAVFWWDPTAEAHADLERTVAHTVAYNDFLLDEWSAAAPGRYIPIAALPYWDVPSAVREVERVAALGYRGVVTTGAPHQHGQPYLGDHVWDPLWSACQDTGLVVCFHAANGDLGDQLAPARVMVDGPEITTARATTAAFLENGHQVTDLLLCGVLARFPELRFVSVESGLGWLPFVLESVDYHFKKSRIDQARPEFGDLLPSDLFRRQVWVNYWFERLEQYHVEAIGADNILFETDFPHSTCLAGDEIGAALENGLTAQPADVQEKILWRNAARLFGLESEA